jgi:hypothetical protein
MQDYPPSTYTHMDPHTGSLDAEREDHVLDMAERERAEISNKQY